MYWNKLVEFGFVFRTDFIILPSVISVTTYLNKKNLKRNLERKYAFLGYLN